MAIKPIDLTGGKSVFCFNESQFAKAQNLAAADDESGKKIQQAIATIEADMTRNERAALAFVLIDRLNKTSPSDG